MQEKIMKLLKNYRSKKSLRAENEYLFKQLHERAYNSGPQFQRQEKKVEKLVARFEGPIDMPFEIAKKSVLGVIMQDLDQYVAYDGYVNQDNGKTVVTGYVSIVKE